MTIKKGQTLPESHRQAISDALKLYWSKHEMSQERRDNISKGQKKHLAQRDSSQVKAHNDAITAGTRKYYETHDGPWLNTKLSEEWKERIRQSMINHWKEKKKQ